MQLEDLGEGIPDLLIDSKVREAKWDFFFQCLTDVSLNIVLSFFPREAASLLRQEGAVMSVI